MQVKAHTVTSESLNAGACVTSSAEGFQSRCLCTLHNIKDLPQHRAGQSPIWHLGHKQPNAQPKREEHRALYEALKCNHFQLKYKLELNSHLLFLSTCKTALRKRWSYSSCSLSRDRECELAPSAPVKLTYWAQRSLT